MSSPAEYPYATFLNILFQPLEIIDEKALADACTHQWYNQTLCQVNGSVIRMGVFLGEYHWHQHTDDDEELEDQQHKPPMTSSSTCWRASC